MQARRKWGAEQATGAPDTPRSGDIPTAWASKTPDGQQEWLELWYSQPLQPLAVLVYQTYNPGALCRLSTFNSQGNEVKLWEGKDPAPSGRPRGVSVVPIETEYKIDRLKIYLDSPAVPGWNEIDAVGIVDVDGKTHWAARASASSTWGQ